MKILFISNIPTPYQNDFTAEVRKYLEIRTYYLWGKDTNRDWALDIENAVIANYAYRLRDYYNYFRYYNIYKPDYILIGGYSIPLSNFAMLLAKINHKKVFYWLERPFESKGIKRIIKNIYMMLKLRCANKIFAIGRLSESIYSKYNKNVINLPYSMNLDGFYLIEKKMINKANLSFLYSGQFIERKNIINLLEAFTSTRYINIELFIMGSGCLTRQVQKYALSDKRIKLLGFIQPQKILEIYRSMDVFILPSFHDGWAIVINEAMASGMPIIGTEKVGAINEYIRHRVNGYICDTTVESVKEGIDYYVLNSELIIQHGIMNREIIRNSLGDIRNAALKIRETLNEP